uniref:Glycerol3phosphate acyltransferase, mitochondrial [Danio rerio] n=2 Tax=Lepeophtheirus salmonis TaxID=72036 RepID=A0A0K2ULZ2_LEPSM
MATPQAKITDFFSTRKRGFEAEPPSKRRKVMGSKVELAKGKAKECKTPFQTPVKSKVPRTPLKVQPIPDKYKLDLTSSLTPKKANPPLSSPFKGVSPGKCPLSPIDVKKRLGQVRKLSELQARLKELSSPEKVSSSPVKKVLQFSYQVPQLLLSPKKALPPASPSKRLTPAYLRHANLTTSLLPIPKNYKKLLTIFSALDQIISLRNNRGESIRLQDLFGPVQNVVRSEVTMAHIEQIRCVHPNAFKFTWERRIGRFGNLSEDYELLIVPSNNESEPLTTVSPSDLVKRKTTFSNALLEITKDFHSKFLLSLDPPIHVDNEKVARWHKDFNPDTCCSDIDVTKLPAKPEINALLLVSEAMRETNKLFHSEISVPAKDEKSSSSVEEDKNDEEEAAFKEALKNRFKGINPVLVKKILAKEKLLMEKELVTDKEKTDELKQIDQLYDVARFLRSTFINEKKVALRMDFLLPRLLKSFSFNAPDMNKMVKLLSELSPTFLKLINIRNTDYAKVDKNVSLLLVEKSINDHKNKK